MKNISAQQWKNHTWQTIAEVASCEKCVHIHYKEATYRLWAWPQELEALVLGHTALDILPKNCDSTPVPFYTGSAEKIMHPSEIHFRVTLAPIKTPSIDCGHIPANSVHDCMDAVMNAPGMWSGTGCFHRAAMVDIRTKQIVYMSEDIGRHNCIDRLMGKAIMQATPPSGYALFVTARITASLYAKARRAGFRCIVSRAAVTSAAYENAHAHGVTLIGFCRPLEQRFTVFTDTTGRIIP